MIKRTRLPKLVILLLLWGFFSLQGQDLSDPAGPEQQINENQEEDLLLKTLPLDISTAGYYELLAWCQRLDLPVTGNREDLQRRIYEYYKISPPVVSPPEKPSRTDVLSIRETQLLEYLSSGEGGHSMIRFSGNVVLDFKEDSGNTHSITADVLVFNKDEKILSAYGNVLYILDKGGEQAPEIFRGNSLTFDIESWAGLFFKGMSEREQEIKNEKIRFLYTGDVITRTQNDTVILDNGVITTCEKPEPHLRIKASKIWVLAPGEWAILNALFYVGRVPMFYFPGFIKNGDPLFFNPVIGATTDKGYLFQTTTYLLGEKTKTDDDSIIDFMQLSGEEDTEREIRGLFLRKTDGLSPFQKKIRSYADSTDSHIKLLADAYTYMGASAGITGKLSRLGYLESFEFYFNIAKSREVFYTDGLYTPYYRNEQGEYVSNWETSQLLNFQVPFRYGLDFTAGLGFGKVKLNLDFPFYSDPFYLADFNNRNETLELDKLINSDQLEETLRRADTSREISSQIWTLNSSWNPAIEKLKPWITTARISRMNNNLVWSRKNLTGTDITSTIDEFFYPSSFSYMDFALQLGGALYKKSEETKIETLLKEDKDTPPGLVSPWPEAAEENELKTEETDAMIPPVMQGDLAIVFPVKESSIYRQELVWSLNPSGNFYGKFNYTQWTVPEDIDYSLDYQVFRGTGDGALTYTGRLMDDLLLVTNKVGINSKYNNYFYRGDAVPDTTWQSYLDQAKALDNFRAANTFTLKFTPFDSGSPLKGSELTYNLNAYLYQWKYDSETADFKDIYFSWNQDSIDKNSLNLNMNLDLFSKTQLFLLDVSLPPTDLYYLATLKLYTGPLATTVIQKVLEKENLEGVKEWVWDPVTFQENLSLFNFLTLSESISYSWEEKEWQTSTSTAALFFYKDKLKLNTNFTYDFRENEPKNGGITIKLWYFDFVFLMSNSFPYEFNLDSGWEVETGAVAKFIPDSLTAGFSYILSSSRFWKNRITLKGEVSSRWSLDLVQFTDSPLTFDLSGELKIEDFMNLSIKSKSRNNSTFRYFPKMAESVGVEPVNPVTDILKSFNFFNPQDRIESSFNLSSISVNLSHDLHDWDLNMEYTGAPKLITSEGYYVYEWSYTFSIYVQWKAWRDLEAKVTAADDELVF